jgi:hypothetical protein
MSCSTSTASTREPLSTRFTTWHEDREGNEGHEGTARRSDFPALPGARVTTNEKTRALRISGALVLSLVVTPARAAAGGRQIDGRFFFMTFIPFMSFMP